jgi:hypothetical protein
MINSIPGETLGFFIVLQADEGNFIGLCDSY